jgi:SAM-dependent methyltransferase
MAIFPQTAAMLVKEHKFRAIVGDVLLIGRQTVMLTVDGAKALLAREGVEVRRNFLNEVDTSTIGSDVAPYITDRSFFSMFSDARVIALDVSDYEDAEIVHDLNLPLSHEYENIADFIFNGSCLDNLFDPATAMKSISKMLRPGGRVVHLEHGTPINGAILCYSPEWFFDFYAINNYADCKVFVCTFIKTITGPWRVSMWHPFYVEGNEHKLSATSLGIGDFFNIVIAEKDLNSTNDRTPIQSHYRVFQNDGTSSIYLRKYEEFSRSGRDFAILANLPMRPTTPRKLLKRWILSGLGALHIEVVKGGKLGYQFIRKRSSKIGAPQVVDLGVLPAF